MTQPSGLRELEELLAKYESVLAEECEGAAWMDYDSWHEEWLRRLTTAEEPLLAALPALIEIARAAQTALSHSYNALCASNGVSDNGWRRLGFPGDFNWEMEIPMEGWNEGIDDLNGAYEALSEALAKLESSNG